jgi:SAM-dependent methyltransferase
MKAVYWPKLEEELGDKIDYLQGIVVNAGCGSRTITIPNAAKIINIDIQQTPQTHIVCDLETIPLDSDSVHGILNIAVLEHCKHPGKVISEFKRILKPNGRILCVVPFMQPEHKEPGDYFRFTEDGIKLLFEENGFELEEITQTHSLFHILGWYAEDLVKQKRIFSFLLFPFFPLLYLASKYCSRFKLMTTPCAITIKAKKKKN